MGKSKKQKMLDLERIREEYPRENRMREMMHIETWAKNNGVDLYAYHTKVAYGRNLKSVRLEQHFTLKQIADILHVSATAVFKIENPTESKKSTKIDLVYLEIFSLIYGVSPSLLLYEKQLVEPLIFFTSSATAIGKIIMTYLLYRSEDYETDDHLLGVFLKISLSKDKNRNMYKRLMICIKQTPLLARIMKLERIIEKARISNDNKNSWNELMKNSNQEFRKAKGEFRHACKCNGDIYQRRIKSLRDSLRKLSVLHELEERTAEYGEFETAVLWTLEKFGSDEGKTMEIFGRIAVAEKTIKCSFCNFIECGGFLDQL